MGTRWSLVLATLGVIGVALQKNDAEAHAANEQARLIQVMEADKLFAGRFQVRCGDPDIRKRDGRDFFLFYVRENVTVHFRAKDASSFGTFTTVNFWQSKPLRVMTIPQVVERLGCGLDPALDAGKGRR